jgi:adenylate cyclase
VAQLNRYFEKMVDAIQSHQGTVDKFLGDGIMAVFGAPLDDSDSALHAVQAALTMLRKLDTLNSEFAAEAVEPIRIGIGIHSGEVIVGNIGSSRKVEYTAIGDVVNATSRIEGLTRTLDTDLLISSVTYELVKGVVAAQYLGDYAVKGKTEMIGIYGVST